MLTHQKQGPGLHDDVMLMMCAIAVVLMSCFWDCQCIDWGLQRWPQTNAYVLELSRNSDSNRNKVNQK